MAEDYTHELIETLDNGEKEDKDRLSGERGLWRAVIAQAVLDATSHSQDKKIKLERSRALSWLSGLSPDFDIVCALADIDTEYVIKRSGKAIKHAHQWRRKNYGKSKPKHIVAKGKTTSNSVCNVYDDITQCEYYS